jgi:hypothetical protein
MYLQARLDIPCRSGRTPSISLSILTLAERTGRAARSSPFPGLPIVVARSSEGASFEVSARLFECEDRHNLTLDGMPPQLERMIDPSAPMYVN